jgi:peptidoglycan/xylan/chitin deacetylase (PgdA/CDA1 family)
MAHPIQLKALTRHLLGATLWGMHLLAWCQVGIAPPTARWPDPAASASPGHLHSTEHIRTQHLQRLHEQATTDPATLREACRYESEISTHPPARQVLLTFDDGPEPGQTEFILATLKQHGIRAVFFLVGQKAARHPELVQAILAADQHAVGNHSWDHPNFHQINTAEQGRQVLLAEATLAPAMTHKLFRYPYGNSSCATNTLLHERGYRVLGWHVDSCDWAFDHHGSVDAREALSCGVLATNHHDYIGHVVSTVRAHNGGVVLMHEIHPNTLKNLDAIIVQIKAEGFEFSSVDAPGFASSMR